MFEEIFFSISDLAVYKECQRKGIHVFFYYSEGPQAAFHHLGRLSTRALTASLLKTSSETLSSEVPLHCVKILVSQFDEFFYEYRNIKFTIVDNYVQFVDNYVATYFIKHVIKKNVIMIVNFFE